MSQPLLREPDLLADRPAHRPDEGAALTLDQVERGGRAEVVGFVSAAAGDGEDEIARRLEDLGVRPGIVIEVRRRAPLGDPTVFELCGYQLCLRRSESRRVRVRALSGSSASDSPETTARR